MRKFSEVVSSLLPPLPTRILPQQMHMCNYYSQKNCFPGLEMSKRANSRHVEAKKARKAKLDYADRNKTHDDESSHHLTDYYFERNLRKVHPYHFTFKSFAKGAEIFDCMQQVPITYLHLYLQELENINCNLVNCNQIDWKPFPIVINC